MKESILERPGPSRRSTLYARNLVATSQPLAMDPGLTTLGRLFSLCQDVGPSVPCSDFPEEREMTALRESAIRTGLHGERDFRWRGGDVSRIEALTDGVFAISITLLIVSLEVPSSIDELFAKLTGFPVFAACFAILYWIWHAHYLFFRRYGLEDFPTRFLNTVLLFVVLFYIYPMKFMITMVIANFTPDPGALAFSEMESKDMRLLMIVYGIGFQAIFLILTFLYRHALRHRKDLQLGELEEYETRTSIITYAIAGSFGAVSALLAIPASPYFFAASGWIYALIGPVMFLHSHLRDRGRAKLTQAL